tara:strand:- start:899 stop:1378 length:480 start_codon:yes stop_codon:yes gene_type:complete
MKNIKIYFLYCHFLVIGLNFSHAQNSPTATGGDASGFNGSVSYSIGQVVFTSLASGTTSLIQGNQQAFEISNPISIEEFEISFNAEIFPNPSSKNLTLKMDLDDSCSYQLIDLNGKLLKTEIIVSKNTTISMVSFPKASYYLRILKKGQILKSFKVIKN